MAVRDHLPVKTLVSLGVVASLIVSACTSGGGTARTPASAKTLPAGPACVKGEDGGCLPIAPAAKRVDLTRPTFTHPTSITNPLFPVSRINQVVFGGQADGEPFRAEVTRLPATKVITWGGQRVETLVSQYVAYADGRLVEVALDWYAQADDGSVWYLGEDVFNFEGGKLANRHGTWLAGKDGPAAMIMPARPKPGQVYRPENAPGLVFEEVTVSRVDETVPGPYGAVPGAIVVSELHQDGGREEKVFAPGYGEFSTGNPKGDLEAVAVAVPTDAVPQPVPASLAQLATAADAGFDAAAKKEWQRAASAATSVRSAWDSYRARGVTHLLAKPMGTAISALAAAVDNREPQEARQAAIDASHVALSLQLRHRPLADIDLARLDLWARQLLTDAAAEEPDAVAGDVLTLGWIWDRVRHAVDGANTARVDAILGDLRAAAKSGNGSAATSAATTLRATLARVRPPS